MHASTQSPLPPTKHRVSMTFETAHGSTVELAGTLTMEGPDLFFLDVSSTWPLGLGEAFDTLSRALRDGRIHVPDEIRAAIDKGARIL